jgi:hypothetical protein
MRWRRCCGLRSTAVYVKSKDSHRLKAMLGERDQLVRRMRWKPSGRACSRKRRMTRWHRVSSLWSCRAHRQKEAGAASDPAGAVK